MYKVTAQINNGNPCPKHEEDAWNYETEEFSTLTECISFLLEKEAFGFSIWKDDKEIANDFHIHCGIASPDSED
jgi:hypothetical protein